MIRFHMFSLCSVYSSLKLRFVILSQSTNTQLDISERDFIKPPFNNAKIFSTCCVSFFLKYTFIEAVSNVSNCLSLLAFLSISYFFQDIRALPESHIGEEPAGEIRGGIHE